MSSGLNRVVVLRNLQPEVLEMVPEGHVCIVKTKSFARLYVYWPGIDKDIEQNVSEHMIMRGPLPGNKTVLVIIDAHSNRIDESVTGTTTSSATIEKLRISFSTYGLPDTVVSDNGTCFTTKELKAFMEQNGIRHITVAPYHPFSNGLAEKAVNIVKDGLKHSDGNLESKLMQILFNYRATPHTATGETPSKLLMGRELKTPLDNLRPNLNSKVESKQQQQKEQHHKRAVQRTFFVGDLVYARNFGRGDAWLPILLVAQTGPVSFVVKLLQGGLVRKHQDQIRMRFTKDSATPGSLQLQETASFARNYRCSNCAKYTRDMPTYSGGFYNY